MEIYLQELCFCMWQEYCRMLQKCGLTHGMIEHSLSNSQEMSERSLFWEEMNDGSLTEEVVN